MCATPSFSCPQPSSGSTQHPLSHLPLGSTSPAPHLPSLFSGHPRCRCHPLTCRAIRPSLTVSVLYYLPWLVQCQLHKGFFQGLIFNRSILRMWSEACTGGAGHTQACWMEERQRPLHAWLVPISRPCANHFLSSDGASPPATWTRVLSVDQRQCFVGFSYCLAPAVQRPIDLVVLLGPEGLGLGHRPGEVLPQAMQFPGSFLGGAGSHKGGKS